MNVTKEIKKVEDRSEAGATMVEYALLVALMAILLMAAIGLMRTSTSTAFSQVGSAVGN